MYMVSKEARDEGGRFFNKKPAFQTTNRLVIASVIWPFQGIKDINTTGGFKAAEDVSTALDECLCVLKVQQKQVYYLKKSSS